MTIDHTVNDLLEGGGTALKFPTIGTTHKGTVISATTSQQTDPNRTPKVWDDGSPMMQIVVTLQTDQRDDPADDGVRRLFVKGGMLNALKAALKSAGGVRLERGGQIAVKYSADGEPTKKGYSPPKQYLAQYRPPAPDTTQAANDLLGASDSATTTTNVSSATWAADGGTPEPGPAESFDPFAEEPF